MKGLLFLFFVAYVCGTYNLLHVEIDRVNAFKKDKIDTIYYDPKNMPLSILRDVVEQCNECTLITAEERQTELAEVWKTTMKKLLDNFKESSCLSPRAILYKNIYVENLTKIAKTKDLTPELLKSLLINLEEVDVIKPVPKFDLSHILKINGV